MIKKIFNKAKLLGSQSPSWWKENVIKLYRAGLKQDYNELTYRFKTSRGNYIWLTDRYTVKGETNDGKKIIVGTIFDITLEKSAQQAFKESEAKFQTLVRNLPGVVYRCEVDYPWQMSFISPEIENLSGIKQEDF